MSIITFIRGLFAALFFGTPNFSGQTQAEKIDSGKVERQVNQGLEVAEIETDAHRAQTQHTIAGGPGSQNIYETFANLPKAERDAMIAARKGVIVRGDTLAACDADQEYRVKTDKIAAALAKGGLQ